MNDLLDVAAFVGVLACAGLGLAVFMGCAFLLLVGRSAGED